MIRDRRRIDPETGELRQPESGAPAGEKPAEAASGDAASWSARHAPEDQDSAELAELRTQVAERTADVQRVSAEYANYRKRVDRDRAAVAETATASVLSSLLPVLDDLERAREHGDLTGAFKAVADQLQGTLEKLGLEQFAEPGDPFDPNVHEAVMHSTSSEVTEPSAVQILRRGYRMKERLLRAALVAVAEPEAGPAAQSGSAGGESEPAAPDESSTDE